MVFAEAAGIRHADGLVTGGLSTWRFWREGALRTWNVSTEIVQQHIEIILHGNSIRHAENQLAAVAPLLCAGITTLSPHRHWGAGPGKKVGIVGIGGLGHMGIKLAHALGAHVVAFTTSASLE